MVGSIMALILFFQLIVIWRIGRPTKILYTITTSGLGLFISTMSRNLAQAAMLPILILMPMIFLSGAWTPPEAMPVGLRQAMYLSPLYYFIEMSYGILLKGAGLRVLWDSLLNLTLLGGVIFPIGLLRFQKQFY